MSTLSNASESSSTSGVNRRDFVRVAAGVAAAGALVGCRSSGGLAGAERPLSAPGPIIPPDRTLRVGLIGCGGRGTGAAVQALRADKNVKLVAMGDVFADRLKSSYDGIVKEMEEEPAKVEVPPERRFVGFDAYEKVIASDVDVVLLTSYPQFRPAHLRAAVAAGKHVFAEKPLAVDAPGVRSVMQSADEAKAKGLALVVGFCWRYNDGMRAMFNKVNSGALGEVTSVHTTYHTTTLSKRPRKPDWSDMEFELRNWWHFTWLAGDHIVEQAVHSIDRMSWAMGDRQPLKVTCLGGRAARTGPESGDAFDHFAAIYEYEGGLRTHHTCRQIDGCPSDNTDYISGTKGTGVVNGWAPTYTISSLSGKPVWKYEGPPIRDMYQVEHDEMFASIRAGRAINDGDRGAKSTLLAIVGRMAAYTGQTITWEQALNSTENLTPASYAFGPMPEVKVAIPGKTKFV